MTTQPPRKISNDIRITRIYDAPVKTVWEAWTDPKKVEQWWGPRGFSITTHSKDLCAGGDWKFTMHGPDGTDYPNHTKYFEVDKYSRLVYDHGGNADQPPLFRVSVNFIDLKGNTRMDMSMRLPTPEAAEEARKFIKQAGGDATWDRLAEYLEKEASGKDTFVINRSFDVSLDGMFEMWTTPKLFSQWLAPTGFQTKFIRADIKAGGGIFYCMTDAGKTTMYGRAKYSVVTKPTRLVYKQQFCDKDEKISRHPLAPNWPETMLTTVTFTNEGPVRTRVTVVWEAHGNVTPEELEVFVKGKAGMTQGWTGSFDKLEECLKSSV